MSGFASDYSGVYGCGLIVVLIVMVFPPDPSPCQPSSAHDRAGVDVPRLTGDRGRSITCKEDRDVRDLNRIEATRQDRKSTRLNSSHRTISYAVFCLKKKTKSYRPQYRTGFSSMLDPFSNSLFATSIWPPSSSACIALCPSVEATFPLTSAPL